MAAETAPYTWQNNPSSTTTDQQRANLHLKMDQIMSCYATEVIIFDIQTKRKDAPVSYLETVYATFPDSFEMETHGDLTIAVNDSWRFAWLFRFKGGTRPSQPQMWMRVRPLFAKEESGVTAVLHEHVVYRPALRLYISYGEIPEQKGHNES